MTYYRATSVIPPLVRRAMDLAHRQGFEISCTAETGRLLSVLTASVHHGLVGEIGAGCGVGTAWMVSALSPNASYITIELDEQRAADVGDLLRAYANVEVLQGDWHEMVPRGPFDLLFVDVGPAKREEQEEVLRALRPGGLAVLDDLTPEDQWPVEWRGQPDPVREFWLNDSRLAATLISVSPTMQILLAVKLP